MASKKPDVILKYKDNNGKKEWHMKVGKEPEKGPGAYDKLIVGKGDNDVFTFAIETSGINFDPANPIKFRLEGGGTDLSDQFIHKIVDGNVLVVADPNSDQVLTEYYYQLNFDNKTFLDPIIQNGCCKMRDSGASGTKLLSATGVIAVLVMAALLASLYIAWVR